ncbi:MAG: D-glycerate dehydrogenase [Pseudomonadota bacterium]|nr:D-glycerate dehydrogenase [Pseudomonadota bacterium]
MTPPSVLLTRRWPHHVEAALSEKCRMSFNRTDAAMDRAAIVEALTRFDIVCPTVTDRIDAAMLGGASLRTKALCNFGAGTGHIDLAACASAGLLVTNTPDVLTDDTADLAMMLALMCARRAGEGERIVRNGSWTRWAPTQLLGTRLSGKTMGIVGFGRIGQATARRARAGFGMTIVYAARRRASDGVEQALAAQHVPLDLLFAQADVISLHVPGIAANRGLIDARLLSLMKPTAILVNTARGEIVDQGALIAALRRGDIAGAGLDVYEDEPHVPDALRRLENVVLLPHLGSATEETRVAMGMRVLANIDAIVAGQPPHDLVA